MVKKRENEVRIIDLVDDICRNKNISKKNTLRIIFALPKVIKNMLSNKQEIVFNNFMKLGFEHVKDRITYSKYEDKKYHRPAHIKFKATFFKEFKKYLNESEKKHNKS